ncbi:MAG TPA: deoxyguanosinetriphosphate triphosphohydrolase [Firmicutes bacterium]|nr:deoxyguanosinetriphosphate triphosphohydrolase [Bacillota bacterium]
MSLEKHDFRLYTEELEAQTLAPWATLSRNSKGRLKPEPPCPVRTAFQRDRDRIIHCKAFRRLKHKTQVFLIPEGDHYRTRLTHTLEVAQIARTIARALKLNEDLVEAIALGHDLGHTPFGHGGEEALARVHPGGFKHNEQSLRVVDVLEGDGGLNLTWEVRDGILNHTQSLEPSTAEGKVVKLSDRIAYINHDIDDAIRGGILSQEDLPKWVVSDLGATHSSRIHAMVCDVIIASYEAQQVKMTPKMEDMVSELREFMFEKVYIDSAAKKEEEKAKRMVAQLYEFYVAKPNEQYNGRGPLHGDVRRSALDYVAGMTDHYAIHQYEKYFVPQAYGFPGG